MAEVTGWQVRAYFNEVHILAQESEAKVDDTTRMKSENGKWIGWPTIEPAEGEEPTTRHQPTPDNTPPRAMRWVRPRAWRINFMEDELDDLEHFWNARSDYVILGAGARNRVRTRRLIDAAIGNATETTEDDLIGGGGSTSVALPARQTIASQASGLTKGKIVAARTRLDGAIGGARGLMGPYYILYDPDDFQTISNESEFNTVDSVAQKQLMSGMPVQGLLGFNWIPTNQLPFDATTNNRKVICWARMGLGCGENQSNKIRAGERSDLSYAFQLFSQQKFDYVRLDDKLVVVIDVDTTGQI